MIAGTLLYHIKDTEQAFWALVDLMEDQELRMIYLSNFDVLKEHCRNIADILVTNVNDLFNHMVHLHSFRNNYKLKVRYFFTDGYFP